MTTAELGRGIGSEFHWMGIPSGEHFAWHPTIQFFARGRDALLALWEHVARPGSRIWVPAFFCQHVVESWRKSGLRIASYLDHPSRHAPDWSSLDAQPHDLVLAVNFFGIHHAAPWTQWKQNNPDVLLIEDHTHDPASRWARESEADFAIASLRKTMPAPDGAAIWSPLHRYVPLARRYKAELRSSSLYLAAMICKSQYLQDAEERADLHRLYRQLEQAAADVPMGHQPRALSPASTSIVNRGVSHQRRERREANCRRLLEYLDLARLAEAGTQPLFQTWPDGHCPLNPILVCRDRRTRDELRNWLIAARIYAPIHWQVEPSPWPEVSRLSERILTVPVDFRCSDAEVRTTAEQLNQFFSRHANRAA